MRRDDARHLWRRRLAGAAGGAVSAVRSARWVVAETTPLTGQGAPGARELVSLPLAPAPVADSAAAVAGSAAALAATRAAGRRGARPPAAGEVAEFDVIPVFWGTDRKMRRPQRR